VTGSSCRRGDDPAAPSLRINFESQVSEISEDEGMPFIGGGHMWLVLVLLVVVLIVWGPGKLPDVGSGLGRAIREFRRTSSDVHDEPPSAPPQPPLL
jgi:sec-independent protein translocase protein TatA